ncbi:helix-turn-helix transcriptional regulator [Sulfurimonas sp.]|uniref:helix-turn-helix domain-containing protein n=1 Tax=Sulfurimonas sp. TaxID=2022749 RepID=UPI0025DB44B1|nr:helix-turn-helix transcriptional regulator [Sulfurimonas sp.]
MKKLLIRICKEHGQREVARRTGVSPASINRIIKGTYPNPQKILEKVKDTFSSFQNIEIECPTLGVIHIDVCSRYKEWSKANKIHKDRIYMSVKELCKKCEEL